MPTEMPLNEPGPSGFTPYPYPRVVGERSGISTRAAQYLDTSAIRAAIRQALHDHQPAGKRYHDGPVAGPAVTKVCRCGHECDGATLAPRTQHLEDVVTAAVLAALCATEESTPTRAEVLRLASIDRIDAFGDIEAAVDVLHNCGLLPWQEETPTVPPDEQLPEGEGFTW